jgi:hypothetical protein
MVTARVRTGFYEMIRWCGFFFLSSSLLRAGDPVLSYSALWAPTGGSPTSTVVTDSNGNIFVAGATNQAIPQVNALQPKLGSGNCGLENVAAPCPDIFAAKLDPNGTQILFSTYLGDNGYDVFGGLAVDAEGNLYVAGTGYAPTPFYPAEKAGTAFVRKLNANGSALLYSQSLGANTQAGGIAVDASGNLLVAGASYSGATGGQHAFVSKLSPSGSVIWTKPLAGSGMDQALAVAVDWNGNTYVAGSTTSPDFPLTNLLQSVYKGTGDPTQPNAFVAEISADGSDLIYSAYLGGRGPDLGAAIGVDANGNAWVTGSTESPDFPLANPTQAVIPVPYGSAFLAQIAAGGGKLSFSTYLNGAFGPLPIFPSKPGPSLTMDSSGNAWVAGLSNALGLPLVNPIQPSYFPT